MADNNTNIKEQNEYDFNKILQLINNKQKDILKKLEDKLKTLDNENNNEKNKRKLILLAIFYSTCISFINDLPSQDITNNDINLIKSLYNENENKYFTSFINSIGNLVSNKINPEIPDNNQPVNNNVLIDNKILEENLLKLDKKKQSLKNLGNVSKEDEKPNITTCFLCVEEFDQNEITNPELECKNHIHGKCFVNYIEEELNNRRFPIRCPICPKNQRHEINTKIILDCLLIHDKDNLALKLETISLNHLAENNSEEVSYCPTAGCNYLCYFDKNEFHLNCPLCKKSYCLKCKVEWHMGMTCEEYQREKKNDENDEKFNEYVRGNNFKQCPRCKRWVEKIDGCNHISCPCGARFCYNCGQLKNNFDHGCPNCGGGIGFGLFGNIRRNIFGYNNPNLGGGLFGYNNNPNQRGGLFGNNNNPNQGEGLFGNNPFNPFLQNNNNQNQRGLFGYNNNNNQYQRGLFDYNNNNQNQGELFGNNNQNQGGLFGNNNQNQGGLFGNNNNNQNQGGFFGNNRNQRGLFGYDNYQNNPYGDFW